MTSDTVAPSRALLAEPLTLPNGSVLDNLTKLTYCSVQMWRMAFGKEPTPGRHAALSVSRYLLNNGWQSLRSPRA